MRTQLCLAGALLACLFAGGCATKAPGYQTSIEKVQTLVDYLLEFEKSHG